MIQRIEDGVQKELVNGQTSRGRKRTDAKERWQGTSIRRNESSGVRKISVLLAFL